MVRDKCLHWVTEDDDALSEEEEEDELVNYLFEENRTLRAEVRLASRDPVSC